MSVITGQAKFKFEGQGCCFPIDSVRIMDYALRMVKWDSEMGGWSMPKKRQHYILYMRHLVDRSPTPVHLSGWFMRNWVCECMHKTDLRDMKKMGLKDIGGVDVE